MDATSISTNILKDRENDSHPNRPQGGLQAKMKASIKHVELQIEKNQ
jgi:hypothetical protein